jgi:cytochrome P450
MTDTFKPPYPPPLKERASFLTRFIRSRKCWISTQFEGSYKMKMGHVHLPGMDSYVFNEPEQVKRALKGEWEKFPKSCLMHRVLEPLLGDSIFTTNGEVWKRQRRLMDIAFGQARLKQVMPLMEQAVGAMLGRFDPVAQNGTILAADVEMTHITADIIFRTILSRELDGEDAFAIFEEFNRYQEASAGLATLVMFHLPAWLSPGLEWFRAKRSAKKIRTFLQAVIRERYTAYQENPSAPATDILGALMEARDPQDGSAFNFKELVDQIAMLFLAGHETSASALSWALYMVAACPDVQQRMADEVRQAVGERSIGFSDIKSLRYTANVFRETLRLYPPVGYFSRQAAETHCARDKTIPAGSSILISPWLIQRHRDLWADPDGFDPDRFDREETKESVKQAYLPFSLGPRVCIGAAFATQEAVLILASLVQRYTFETLPDHVPIAAGRLTVRPVNGVRLRVGMRGK